MSRLMLFRGTQRAVHLRTSLGIVAGCRHHCHAAADDRTAQRRRLGRTIGLFHVRLPGSHGWRWVVQRGDYGFVEPVSATRWRARRRAGTFWPCRTWHSPVGADSGRHGQQCGHHVRPGRPTGRRAKGDRWQVQRTVLVLFWVLVCSIRPLLLLSLLLLLLLALLATAASAFI